MISKAQMDMGKNFREDLLALEAAGLDIVELLKFFDEHPEFTWPESILHEFFDWRLSLIVDHFPDIYSRSFFSAMAIDETHLDEVIEEWNTLAVDMDVIAFLADKYSILARPLQFGSTGPTIKEEPVDSPTISQQNINNLLNSSGPSVILQVQSGRDSLFASWEERLINILTEMPVGAEYYYHSTSLEKAVSILESGPLVQLSKIRYDFDSAFYLNFDADLAVEWARRKAIQGKGVVLVYRIPKEFWESLNVHVTTDETWNLLVKNFRREIYSNINMEAFLSLDAIMGPICRNILPAREALQRTDWEPLARNDNQVAIINAKVAIKLNAFLHGILKIF